VVALPLLQAPVSKNTSPRLTIRNVPSNQVTKGAFTVTCEGARRMDVPTEGRQQGQHDIFEINPAYIHPAHKEDSNID